MKRGTPGRRLHFAIENGAAEIVGWRSYEIVSFHGYVNGYQRVMEDPPTSFDKLPIQTSMVQGFPNEFAMFGENSKSLVGSRPISGSYNHSL